MISQSEVEELLSIKDGYLYHRESQELEFKEQYNLNGLADYFKDFSAFANNRGGLLIFGVKDSPRSAIGLSEHSLEQFNKIDPEKISGYLLDYFSADIRWELKLFQIGSKKFGVFQIFEAKMKPIIVKKQVDGKFQNGDIFYRYGGRTQKILYSELQNIIEHRVEENNLQWIDLMSKIGKAGPQNAAILDTEKAIIENGHSQILVLDEVIAKKLKFIREGEFVEKEGATALKLVGDVVPIEQVEVVRKVKENLTKMYPLSATELAELVKSEVPSANTNEIWSIIKDNGIKSNSDYSAYVFRNKKLEDEYKKTNVLPNGTPSIYNTKAVAFIVNLLTNNDETQNRHASK